MQIVAELRVARTLAAEGPTPAGALAERGGADPGTLHRLLRALASDGIFVETEPGVFAHTPASELLARDAWDRSREARKGLRVMRAGLICSVLATAGATACAASAATASSYVYVTAWNDQKVDEFKAGPTGALTKIGSVDAVDSEPWYMAMTANLRNKATGAHLESLYEVTYTGNDLISYTVSSTGKLVHKSPAQGGQVPAGTKPYGIALSPDDRNAYVPDYQYSGTVYIFNIAPDGSVKPHTPAFITTPGNQSLPAAVAVSRNGKSVYVAESGSDDILHYARASDGSLTARGTPVPTGSSSSPDWISITPNGKYLYVANYNSSSIGIFNVAQDGSLKQQADSPVKTGYGTYEMAISPNGKSLYATDCCDGSVTYVHQFTIQANGFLVRKQPATVAAGVNLDGIWLSPNGKAAYVANAGTYPQNQNDWGISQFKVGSTGLLAPLKPPSVATDNYPAAITVTPDRSPIASFTASGKATSHTRTFNASASTDPDGTVAEYRWNFGDGVLSQQPRNSVFHIYKHPGTYTVTLTVTDNAGCSTSMIWTGQMAYCDGGSAAEASRIVIVKKRHRRHHHH